MANSRNFEKPDDDGKIKLPSIAPGMNKLGPTAAKGGKGSKLDDTKGVKRVRKRRVSSSAPTSTSGPPLSESIDTTEDEDTVPQPTYDGAPKADENLDAEEKQKILTRVRKRMDRCIQSESDNRKAAVEDLKFLAGDQWPADILARRNDEKRPAHTINELPTFVNQIVNDLRQNRPAINVSPVGDKGDPEVAKMYRGLIRHIERSCTADIAYDTGVTNSASNGFGYWRVSAEWENEDSFNQVIVVKRIRNPFTVYLDPDCQDPTGADARYGFVTEMVPRKEFEEEWPDADPMPFTQGGAGEAFKSWQTEDSIRVAEYFEAESAKRTLVALSTGFVGWKDELKQEVRDDIAAGKIRIIRERESEDRKVHWYKLTAKDILEQRIWLGSSIPIVRVIGTEIDIEGKVRYSGVVRYAKDPQRTLNYFKTAMTEVVALQPKAPFVGEEGQFEGHEDEWRVANTVSQPYLQYKAVNVNGTLAPPPQRQPMSAVPAGIENAIQGARQDLMATTGVRFDATVHERLMDESGKAITELRRNTDLGSFHYADNLARALRRTGEMFIELIPKIYDTKRIVTILREDDSEEQVQIDPSSAQPFSTKAMPPDAAHPTQRVMKIFNPTYGQYGVTVTIGESYATKRIEAADSMMKFATAFPQSAPLIMDIVAKEMDWNGAEQIAARLAKAIPPNLLTPDSKDLSPQIQAIIQSMKGEIQQLTQQLATAAKALVDKQADRAVQQDAIDKRFEAAVLKTIADIETKQAATQEKAVASFNAHVASRLDELGTNTRHLIDTITKLTAPKTNGAHSGAHSEGRPNA